jgi:hypothetical protein
MAMAEEKEKKKKETQGLGCIALVSREAQK